MSVRDWLTFYILNATWQLPALLLVTAALVRFLPRRSVHLPYHLWVSCLLLAIALPAVSASLALSPAHQSLPAVRSDDPLRWKVPHPPPSGRLTLHLTEIPASRSISRHTNVLTSLYLGLVLLGLGRLVFRLNRTRQIVRRASKLELDPASRLLLDRCMRLYQTSLVQIPVEVLVSAEIVGPATVTWPVPILLVPPSFSALAQAEATVILAHELAHVFRHDFATNLALEALAILLLFHPATPWLKRRIAESREIVCDDLAAHATCGRAAYARSLLRLARSTAGIPFTPSSMALSMSGTPALERRIMKLVHTPHPLSKPRRLLLNTLCLSALSAASLAAVLLSLHPSSVHAAGAPSFPFDPTQTFDSLASVAERKSAPNFTLTDNHGETITLSDYKGKVVLLDFWATWCGGCKLEIPWYMEFDRKYRDSGLAVIGVSMDEKGWATVRPFLAKQRDDETGGIIAMQYPVVIGNNELAGRFGLTSLPMTLLIDKSGKIAVSHTGVVDKENFERNLRTLLK